jgi:small GTP-binding protein
MNSEINIFISYAREDSEIADRLYDDLKKTGSNPWMDRKDLLAGSLWKKSIKRAIQRSNFFLVLLSSNSISKRGFVNKELIMAFDVLDELPSEDIFIIPIRLNECEPPYEKIKNIQWVDLFPSYESGLSKILKALLPHKTDLKMPLNEVKLLLVGQGSVGKTSVVNRILNDEFNPNENKTDGININKWFLTINNQNFRTNIWDFGGQEIMHATHQFFLTRRSIYLLVLDCRIEEEENRIEYWLKIIQSFGGDSPVIVVGNKVDQKALDIDRRGLQNKYKNIKSIIETSCESGSGINNLKTIIENEIGKLEHIHNKLLATWFNVKSKLENMKKDFIPFEEYRNICETENITEDISQQTLLRYLHDLGIVLNFRDDPRLVDTNILNPEWVTLGVYKIINSNELFQNKGILEIDILNRILDKSNYPRNKHMFIIDMMRKFELCFDFEGFKDQKFLVPDLISKEEPFTGDWNETLEFQYNYQVLPNSIISRFIVRMHSYIYLNTYWRTGVIVAYQNDKALVKADIEDRKIYIKITGSFISRRNFLTIIRSHFDTIHKTIPKIEAKEKLVFSEDPTVIMDYEHLLRLEALGVRKYIPEGTSKKIHVKKLLNEIEPPKERYEKIMKYKEDGNSKTWEKIVAFVFGISFVTVMLYIAIFFPNPTDFQIFIFRVVLALSASGIGAVIPGFINLEITKDKLMLVRAGGAIALFLLIYLINPPVLVSTTQ